VVLQLAETAFDDMAWVMSVPMNPGWMTLQRMPQSE
jgi:hypothetical protein